MDHFIDWPLATHKPNCLSPDQYTVTDRHVSAVVYMSDELESLPIQTYLSIVQFSRESDFIIDKIILAYADGSPVTVKSHKDHVEYIRDLADGVVVVESVLAETEWKAKHKAVEMVTTKQVHGTTCSYIYMYTPKNYRNLTAASQNCAYKPE